MSLGDTVLVDITDPMIQLPAWTASCTEQWEVKSSTRERTQPRDTWSGGDEAAAGATLAVCSRL